MIFKYTEIDTCNFKYTVVHLSAYLVSESAFTENFRESPSFYIKNASHALRRFTFKKINMQKY